MDKNTPIRIRTALLSVSDKTGIVELAQTLDAAKVKILSTGGTAKTIREAGITVTDVAAVTNQPEIMGGRVKTLHPKIHGGLLARRDIDADVMQLHAIDGIDLLVVNLYPFEETISRIDCEFEQAIEQIDIGGPAMLRGACKNHRWVTVLTDPSDYKLITPDLPQAPNQDQRLKLALKGFQMTANYDSAISRYLEQQTTTSIEQTADMPAKLDLSLVKQQPSLRYGENPHQQAALYCPPGKKVGIVAATQLQGKALSYNNWMDADAAWQAMLAVAKTTTISKAACVIVKHANPCGAALADDLSEAYKLAFQCDSTSAFGGIIAINQTLTAKFAQQVLDNQFLEVLIAPAYEDNALEVLENKPNVRVLINSLDAIKSQPALADIRRINGGYLVQEADFQTVTRAEMQIVSHIQPNENQWQDLLFAWQLVRGVKSNAVVYAKNGHSLGIGAGQMSRIDSAMIAAQKCQQAGWNLNNAAMASEAFFPFRDSVDAAHQAGVTCVIQPGGSMRDQELIDAVNEHSMCMVFTARRHFRH